MITRFLALLVMIWALGFVWFAVALPRPLAGVRTDAVVVPTGGKGRIDRGLEVLRTNRAPLLLVTGVYSEVTPAEFAAEFHVGAATMRCCVTLDFAAVDTRTNASQTAAFVARYRIRSLRLVTSDWHMRRAAQELRAAMPEGVTIVEDAVTTQPSFDTLFLEYHKLIFATAAQLGGGIKA